MPEWTLTYQSLPGGTPVTKTFAAWGLSQPILTRAHFTGDELRFSVVDQAAFTSANPFPVGATGFEHRVWASHAGVIRFVGYLTQVPRLADGKSEQKDFVASGMGQLLQRLVFKQVRKAGFAGTTPPYNLTPYKDSHVFLGQNASGVYQNTGQQIDEILTYAELSLALDGHLFQHSTSGFPAVNILLDEATGITCEQALHRMLAHSPDYVMRWDYSTTDAGLPKPTVRIQSRAAMTAKTLPWTAGSIRLTPRYDLLQRGVFIRYEKTAQYNGQSVVTWIEDAYPATINGQPITGDELGVMAATVSLQGSTVQTMVAELHCDAINAANASDGLRISWWIENYPALRDAGNLAKGLTYNGSGEVSVPVEAGKTYFFHKWAATNDLHCINGGTTLTSSGSFVAAGSTVTLTGTINSAVLAFVGQLTIAQSSVSRSGTHNYPRRLTPSSGGLAPWMGFHSELETIRAQAFFVDPTGGHYLDLAVNVTSTDAVAGTFAKNLTLFDGEPVPSGLAQKLYESLSVLHWQGDITLTQQDFDWAVGLGHVLNLTGADSALETSRLMIWRETIDVQQGTARLEFGDPEHVGIGDLVDRLRALRLRQLVSNPQMQSTGLTNGDSESTVASVNALEASANKTTHRLEFIMQHPNPTGSGVTQQVQAKLEDLPTGVVARWQLTHGYEIVSGACVARQCYMLRTDWV